MKKTLLAAIIMAFAATAYAKAPVKKAPYKSHHHVTKANKYGYQKNSAPKPYEGGQHKGTPIGQPTPAPSQQGYAPQPHGQPQGPQSGPVTNAPKPAPVQQEGAYPPPQGQPYNPPPGSASHAPNPAPGQPGYGPHPDGHPVGPQQSSGPAPQGHPVPPPEQARAPGQYNQDPVTAPKPMPSAHPQEKAAIQPQPGPAKYQKVPPRKQNTYKNHSSYKKSRYRSR